jgi:hypothetical protein
LFAIVFACLLANGPYNGSLTLVKVGYTSEPGKPVLGQDWPSLSLFSHRQKPWESVVADSVALHSVCSIVVVAFKVECSWRRVAY